ncbi:MAG: MBL fold metallo-hydrolase [Planctomycetes bacterium]|nr:MBL fold metallo-hydrolase [Planctomycetota bacterium]
MKIQFLGAARAVTGSCHLLQVGRHKVLLDCGLHQGRRKESFERNRTFAFQPPEIDAVILSHAHIDHSGNLPTLVARGFRGRIYATEATQDLCEWMLRDSAHIQEKDVEYVNQKRRKKGQNPFEPLYTMRDAEATLERFRGVPYDREVKVGPGIRVRFRDAGHILGSASCHVRVEEKERGVQIVYTGDIGRADRPILRDPVPPREADVLICESTYGDRLHPKREDVKQRLRDVVRETYERGGKLLIPAFSVGRTQRIVYELHELFNEGQLSPLPIFVDSPLSTNVTQVFRDHPECYDQEALHFVEGRGDPFGFARLTYIRDVSASIALNSLSSPCVIIAASGMCEAGRVLHHLKRIAPDERSTILIAGFMAEHTLGRRIKERATSIKLYGDEYPLRARVEEIEGLSAHGDRDEMLEYLSHMDQPPGRTFVVHGEEAQSLAFAERLRERGFPSVEVPAAGEKAAV